MKRDSFRPSMSVQRSILMLAAWLSLPACYLSHGVDDDLGLTYPDGALRDLGRDMGRPRDGAMEAGDDLGMDGGTDFGLDMGVPGVDAAPPTPLPPDPSVCRTGPRILPFADPVIEAQWPEADDPINRIDEIHVCDTPLVVDLDPDGETVDPEIVFVSYRPLGRDEQPGCLRIWKPREHRTISVPSDDLSDGVYEATTNLAAADLDGDGRPEIVGLGVYDGTVAYHGDGTMFWTSPNPNALWRGLEGVRSIAGAITIADLENDGLPEVIAGNVVLNGQTGALKWQGPAGYGKGTNQVSFGPISCVADLDGDGRQEVIAGKTAYHADGSVMWTSTAPDGFCAIVDIRADLPGPEVVLVSNGYVRILNGADGTTLWTRMLVGRVLESIGGPPNVGDFDGDGHLEIGVAHGASYGVYDPDCTGVGTPAGCADVGLLWQSPTNDNSSSCTGSTLFDYNGDGAVEVTYNDQQYFRVYSGRDGTILAQHPNSSRTRTENPVIADVDNDGQAEIVFSANAEAFFIREWFTTPGVFIWGDARGGWVGARRIWNQHAYHVTNVTEDGRIPAPETSSWTVLNAYRQNEREGGGDVLVTPDLWGGAGSYTCLGGTMRLAVLVQNFGLERVGPGIVVSFWRGNPEAGGTRIGETLTTTRLEPESPGEVVTFDTPFMGPVTDYYAKLDDPDPSPGDNGALLECREDNNEVLIWRPRCP